MNSTPEEPNQSRPHANQNLSRWFWGTIILFAVLSILLTLLAEFRYSDAPTTQDDADSEGVDKTDTNELSGTRLERILNKSNQVGLEMTKQQIGPLLEAAYAPVYDAIPAYTDFHYSLPGEYLELTEAAIGDLGGAIQTRLFPGHEERLERVMYLLDESFEAVYREQIEKSLTEALPAGSNDTALGPLTQSAIEGAKTRIKVTAPVAGLVMIGGAASLKAASTLIAKKIAAKIGIKAAAKSGAKWAAAATGAGGGAVVCSWAGPVAGICAAGGAVIAWVAVDITVLKLDEIMNREEFEANLRSLIDDAKSARRSQLENALVEKSNQVQAGIKIEISDFTLKQLTRPEAIEVCSTAASFISEYAVFRTNLSKRNPASIRAFRSRLAKSARDDVLGPLVHEIERNLPMKGSQFTVTQINISGNLPFAFRDDRDISARMSLDRETIEFDRTDASEDSGFVLRASPGISLVANSVYNIRLAIEQHRLFLSNKRFGGAVDLDILGSMSNSSGLAYDLALMIPIVIDDDSESLEEVDARLPSGHPIAIEISITGDLLPELKGATSCPEILKN